MRQYLDIEQARFGERLAVDVNIDADAWNGRVPVMLLQPIVENAIKHAIATRERGGRIVVGARREDGMLDLFVDDDGPGLTPSNGDGVGLTNVRQRLEQLYAANQRLDLLPNAIGGVRVHIRLPYRE